MAARVAINGFGRIGRLVFRAAMEAKRKDIEFVAINDLGKVTVRGWGGPFSWEAESFAAGRTLVAACPERESFWVAGRHGDAPVLVRMGEGKPSDDNSWAFKGLKVGQQPVEQLALSADGRWIMFRLGLKSAVFDADDLCANGHTNSWFVLATAFIAFRAHFDPRSDEYELHSEIFPSFLMCSTFCTFQTRRCAVLSAH